MTAPCKSNVYFVTNKAMKGEPEDRISNLPSSLLERVLVCMPLHDAVRTSILSSRWRHNWAGISQLVFGEVFFQKLNRVKGPDSPCAPLIISEVLLLHKGPILKFVLSFPAFLVALPRFYAHVYRWMLFLSRNGVKELILVNSPHVKHNLGSYFFSCSELTHLKLEHYNFEPPSSFNGFQYLTSLTFRNVRIRTNVLEAVISDATMLENLVLEHCLGVDTVNITALYLKYLHIDGAYKSIALTNTTNLVEAYLSLYQMKNHPMQQKSNLIEVCGFAPRIEKLVLAHNIFRIISADGIPTKLPAELLYLKHLKLSHIIFHEPEEFASALGLIRSSPNLRTLEILSPTFKFVGVYTSRKLSETHFEGFTLDNLQIVRMLDVKGISPELDLIKFLLASAPRLDSMFIRRHICINQDAEVTLSRALLQYPRASPIAKVEYLEPVDENKILVL